MGNVLRIITATLLTACLMLPGGARAAELGDVVATLEKGYGAMADLQADFSQRTSIASLQREERGSGELLLKKGSGGQALFRFDYRKPKQLIVSDGTTVWYYLPDNRQVLKADAAKLFAGGNAIALSYLTGLGHLSRDFTIAFAGEGRDKKGNYLLDLVPKKPSAALKKLQLTVATVAVERYLASGTAEVAFPIMASTLVDQLGNRTVIEYSNIKVNRGLGNQRFSFKVPAGVEVIKQ
ncbi:MAG TPA: outer membrane lipoprotein carrier protein LolA [Geobacteraceae bacterium]